ncbi:hypothetical protein V495_05915 [Pseudogymnoascus sp. VKM F-4514 (FW-929)]|nr:hypothetical protein V495_05915 [Pseudogymnoascus sp. VKM F-4514 (FW-929)]
MATEIVDDKSSHCIPFILSRHAIHTASSPSTPFFIGINGVQGVGKSTLVSLLLTTLRDECNLATEIISLDDLYLTHADQVALAQANPLNPLVQHRGEPGTHDIPVAQSLFTSLRNQTETSIPRYDKSAFSGQGDRSPTPLRVNERGIPLRPPHLPRSAPRDRESESRCGRVNEPSKPKVQVIILEGWSVGFRALTSEEVTSKREASRSNPDSTLWKNRLEDLLFVNDKLREYDVMTDMLDAFIHLDASETAFVYAWRREQEAALRVTRGVENAMTDEQVVRFVDGYYPAYELFTDDLRKGVFRGDTGKKGSQLRLIVGRDRRVIEVEQI